MPQKAATTLSCLWRNKRRSTHGWRHGGGFSLAVVDWRPGLTTLKIAGPDAVSVFQHEAGGHRWQRKPPNEKRDRVHTSTVTVAVLSEPPSSFAFAVSDVEFSAARGHGAGGQHRNVTESAVRAVHRPTGIEAFSQSERSQHRNKAAALDVLKARVYDAAQQSAHHETVAGTRRRQVGTGQRGDKRRTIRQQDGQVHDHLTGRRWRFDDYVRGQW